MASTANLTTTSENKQRFQILLGISWKFGKIGAGRSCNLSFASQTKSLAAKFCLINLPGRKVFTRRFRIANKCQKRRSGDEKERKGGRPKINRKGEQSGAPSTSLARFHCIPRTSLLKRHSQSEVQILLIIDSKYRKRTKVHQNRCNWAQASALAQLRLDLRL